MAAARRKPVPDPVGVVQRIKTKPSGTPIHYNGPLVAAMTNISGDNCQNGGCRQSAAVATLEDLKQLLQRAAARVPDDRSPALAAARQIDFDRRRKHVRT
jgi:hypothetical protein